MAMAADLRSCMRRAGATPEAWTPYSPVGRMLPVTRRAVRSRCAARRRASQALEAALRRRDLRAVVSR